MAQAKIAWIIGGGSGIGAAVARELANRGWQVAISGRRQDRLASVAEDPGGIHPYPLDVTEDGAAEMVLRAIIKELGRVDLFLYGAVSSQSTRPGDYDSASFASHVETNLVGLVRTINPLVRQMEMQGGGQLAALSSVAGYFGLPGAAAYSATKAAMISLLQTLASELRHKNIQVRLISPSFVKSELTARNKYPMPFLMETDQAAKRIVDGLLRSNRFEIAFPRRMAWPMKVMRMLPYPLFFWFMSKLPLR